MNETPDEAPSGLQPEPASAGCASLGVGTSASRPLSRSRRLALPVGVGLAACAAVVALRRVGVLEGPMGLGYAALLTLAVPWSAQLSRRILIAGAVVLGWVPFLWWIPFRIQDRVGLLMAVGTGALTAWLLSGPGIRGRLRRMLPSLDLNDGLPLAAGALTAVVFWPLLSAPTGDRMLNVLMKSGWDHGAHFAMVLEDRVLGTIVPFLSSAPDGTPWVGATYPQHFHAMTTALTESVARSAVGDPALELLRYGRSMVLIHILLAVLLAAAISQVPPLRRRPLLAWPLGALLVAALAFGPGSIGIIQGYPNFIMACVCASLTMPVALSADGAWRPVSALALGGLVAATVHTWVLLAPLAITGAALVLVPLARSRWPRHRGDSIALATVVGCSLLASAAGVPMTLKAGGISSLAEGDPRAFVLDMLLPYACAAVAIALTAAYRQTTRPGLMRCLGLAAVPLVGLVLLSAIGLYQLATSGGVSYYFGKFGVGVSLVSIAALVIGLAYGAPARRTETGHARRAVSLAACIIGTFACLQWFGFVGPPRLSSVFTPATAVRFYSDTKTLTSGASSEALRTLAAARVAKARPFGSAVYIGGMPGDPIGLLANQWSKALSMTWSYGTDKTAPSLAAAGGYADADTTAEVAGKLLDQASDIEVIVAPDMVAEVRGRLPATVRERVVTW